MKIYLEIYFTKIEGEFLYYDSMLTDITNMSADIDHIALGQLSLHSDSVYESERFILHSTSWRHDFYKSNHSIILTYIAYSDHLDASDYHKIPLKVLENRTPPYSAAQKPKPSNLDTLDILRQGIKHLSSLLFESEQSKFSPMINEENKNKLAGLYSELGGRV